MSFEFIHTNKNLTYLTIPLFSKTGKVVHAFTTRKGGAGKPPFSSLNLGLHVGDNRSIVLSNREKICNVLGIRASVLVAAQQVHGDRIHAVGVGDRGKGALDAKSAVPNVDALVTNVAGLPLIAFFADCTCLFFLDPVCKVIGLAHAGWKGTALKIGEKTVKYMLKKYGCNPRDILVGIGPSIGPCCYEVDDRVKEIFADSFPEWDGFLKPKHTNKWNLDLWEANRKTLMSAGVPLDNIAIAGLCTSCNNELFFSYRAESKCTGRLAAILMLE